MAPLQTIRGCSGKVVVPLASRVAAGLCACVRVCLRSGSRWPGITWAFCKPPSSRKCGGPEGPSGGYKGPSKIYKLGSASLYLTYGGKLLCALLWPSLGLHQPASLTFCCDLSTQHSQGNPKGSQQSHEGTVSERVVPTYGSVFFQRYKKITGFICTDTRVFIVWFHSWFHTLVHTSRLVTFVVSHLGFILGLIPWSHTHVS